jgi:thiol-disulfide isomerase/thioredoxin
VSARRSAALSGVAATLLACAAPSIAACAAPPEVRREDLGVQLSPAEVAEIQARLGRVDAMETEIARLRERTAEIEARLALAESRTGLAEFVPAKLKRPPGGPLVLSPIEGQFVSERGARPVRRRLADHVAGFDGALVAFWATWCVPCTSPEELAHLHRLQTALRGRGFELVSIAIDDLDRVLGDRRAGTWLHPFWQKDDAHIEMLPRAFIERVGLELPLFLLVSRSGRVQFYWNQKLDDEVAREIVTAMGLFGRL